MKLVTTLVQALVAATVVLAHIVVTGPAMAPKFVAIFPMTELAEHVSQTVVFVSLSVVTKRVMGSSSATTNLMDLAVCLTVASVITPGGKQKMPSFTLPKIKPVALQFLPQFTMTSVLRQIVLPG